MDLKITKPEGHQCSPISYVIQAIELHPHKLCSGVNYSCLHEQNQIQ